jgi:mannose-6-phosphate isomerase
VLFLCDPRRVPRLWGSLPGGDEGPLGELWWIYHDEDGSTLLTGPRGTETTTLDRLVRSGSIPGGVKYPLMVKTLHTRQRLSVQVHPGAFEGPGRKEETWIVLRALPGAWMMGGLRTEVGPESFVDLDLQGVERVLHRIPLADGDIWHIPPGTVHALGPDLEVLEIQDNCDVTYRLYDWGRIGPDGKPRRLHLEQGMASIAPPPGGVPVRAGTGGRLFPDAILGGSYALRQVAAPSTVPLSAGEVFFLAFGRLSTDGEIHDSPACLIAADGGGDVKLVEGVGYRVIPGGGR